MNKHVNVTDEYCPVTRRIAQSIFTYKKFQYKCKRYRVRIFYLGLSFTRTGSNRKVHEIKCSAAHCRRLIPIRTNAISCIENIDRSILIRIDPVRVVLYLTTRIRHMWQLTTHLQEFTWHLEFQCTHNPIPVLKCVTHLLPSQLLWYLLL